MGDSVNDGAVLEAGSGSTLSDGDPPRALATLRVELENPDDASGLADMLHQFLEQTVASCPEKRRAAERLSGTLWFQSAEETSLVVALTFSGNGIRVADTSAAQIGRPSLTADILSTAHITTGQVSPFTLLLRKEISARVKLSQVLFLLRVLRFMKVEDEGDEEGAIQSATPAIQKPLFWVLVTLVLAVTAALLWFARA